MTLRRPRIRFLFFFNDTATTEIYTLSLHDALPICLALASPRRRRPRRRAPGRVRALGTPRRAGREPLPRRSEEHTSELQSPCNLVCRLLLEKKKYSSSNPDYFQVAFFALPFGCLSL